jgi:hypothetical protein
MHGFPPVIATHCPPPPGGGRSAKRGRWGLQIWSYEGETGEGGYTPNGDTPHGPLHGDFLSLRSLRVPKIKSGSVQTLVPEKPNHPRLVYWGITVPIGTLRVALTET